jgi:hypothetical protein
VGSSAAAGPAYHTRKVRAAQLGRAVWGCWLAGKGACFWLGGGLAEGNWAGGVARATAGHCGSVDCPTVPVR